MSSQQRQDDQECGGISKTYTSKGVYEWYSEKHKSTMKLIEEGHQQKIKKIRDEMKTKFDKAEKENKLLQKIYNQLQDKLKVLHDVTAEQLKVVRENVRGMEFAFVGEGFFSKIFNLLDSR